jgi:hypothetical protein
MTTHTSRPSSRQPAVVTLDREAARVAIRAAAGRFTALLRETNDIERPAAGTDWSVAETAAHVLCIFTGRGSVCASRTRSSIRDTAHRGDLVRRPYAPQLITGCGGLSGQALADPNDQRGAAFSGVLPADRVDGPCHGMASAHCICPQSQVMSPSRDSACRRPQPPRDHCRSCALEASRPTLLRLRRHYRGVVS